MCSGIDMCNSVCVREIEREKTRELYIPKNNDKKYKEDEKVLMQLSVIFSLYYLTTITYWERGGDLTTY